MAKATIANFETDKREPYERTLADLEATLNFAGVVFLADKEMVAGGPGVRLKGE